MWPCFVGTALRVEDDLSSFDGLEVSFFSIELGGVFGLSRKS